MLNIPLRFYRMTREHGLRPTLAAAQERFGLLGQVMTGDQETLSALARSVRASKQRRPVERIPPATFPLDPAVLLAATPTNVEANRALWDAYATYWRLKDAALGSADVRGVAQHRVPGEEWGSPDEIRAVLEEFLLPYVTDASVVAEIGVGGGRAAALVAPHVRELVAFDVSREMLALAAEQLRDHANIRLQYIERSGLPEDVDGRLDAAYALDVFPFLDLVEIRLYLAALARSLRPGGLALIHAANLTTEAGWRDFRAQQRASLEGKTFVVPETVRVLAARSGLEVVKESPGDSTAGGRNRYLVRDYLVLLRKP
jgi:SAM-dependent methyltransferase